MRHGEDLFCFRLKSRFEPGDALIVCPGAPNRACEMMYSQRAWDMGLACHACGWDPATPEWRPERAEGTLKHKTPASERLFELARARKTRVRKSKRHVMTRRQPKLGKGLQT